MHIIAFVGYLMTQPRRIQLHSFTDDPNPISLGSWRQSPGFTRHPTSSERCCHALSAARERLLGFLFFNDLDSNYVVNIKYSTRFQCRGTWILTHLMPMRILYPHRNISKPSFCLMLKLYRSSRSPGKRAIFMFCGLRRCQNNNFRFFCKEINGRKCDALKLPYGSRHGQLTN